MKNRPIKHLVIKLLFLVSVASILINPYLRAKYKNLASKFSNWLLSNDKFSYNNKDYEGYDKFGYLWMRFRGRDLVTKIISEKESTFFLK